MKRGDSVQCKGPIIKDFALKISVMFMFLCYFRKSENL